MTEHTDGDGTVQLTKVLIHEGGTSRDGFTREQLALLGVNWPPPKGWLKRLDGTRVLTWKFVLFMALKNGKSGKTTVTVERSLTPADLPPYAAYCGVHANTPALAAMRRLVEQYRRECEARGVLRLPFEKRKPWLEAIGKRRGEAGRKYLEEEVIRQYRLTRQMELI